MRSKVSGAWAAGTCSANHAVTRSASMPFTSLTRPPPAWSSASLDPVGERNATGRLRRMSIDVTDATFPTDVVERSNQVPVVVDLWAEWCGPCRTLGPILEKVIDETEGKVVLAKVDVD